MTFLRNQFIIVDNFHNVLLLYVLEPEHSEFIWELICHTHLCKYDIFSNEHFYTYICLDFLNSKPFNSVVLLHLFIFVSAVEMITVLLQALVREKSWNSQVVSCDSSKSLDTDIPICQMRLMVCWLIMLDALMAADSNCTFWPGSAILRCFVLWPSSL